MKKIRLILLIISILLIVAANLSLILVRLKINLPPNDVLTSLLIFLNIGLLASAGFIMYGTGKDRDQVINAGALLVVSYTYISELISSTLIFGFIPDFPFMVAFVTQLLTLVLYTALALLVVLGILFRKAHNKEIREKINFIKTQEEEVMLLINKASDSAIQNKLQALKEKIRFSDPMTSDECHDVEEEIKASIKALNSLIYDEDQQKVSRLIDEISGLFDKRNSICLRTK